MFTYVALLGGMKRSSSVWRPCFCSTAASLSTANRTRRRLNGRASSSSASASSVADPECGSRQLLLLHSNLHMPLRLSRLSTCKYRCRLHLESYKDSRLQHLLGRTLCTKSRSSQCFHTSCITFDRVDVEALSPCRIPGAAYLYIGCYLCHPPLLPSTVFPEP